MTLKPPLDWPDPDDWSEQPLERQGWRVAGEPGHYLLEHLQVLRLQPGDLLVLANPGRLGPSGAARLREALNQVGLTENKVLVLEDGMRLGAIRTAKEEAG